MLNERRLSDIYDRTHRRLFLFILRFVGSPETAEDILHDAFVRLIQYASSREFDDRGVESFLFTAARNLCVDRARREARVRFDELTEAPSSDDVEERLARDELRERIDRLVASKDPQTRSIFYMKTELGMTYQEIASRLKISERTAKRKMAALVSSLASDLERNGYSRFYSVLVSLAVL